jgi:carboxymethylenebutenolidase
MVEFPARDGTASGYLATAGDGAGLGVVVVQEIWGLVPHIQEVCDRFAAEGFTALAPDLYDGETAKVGDVDGARALMQSTGPQRVAAILTGAVDLLAGHEAVRGDGVGVIGFCSGGGQAMWLATLKPDKVKAAVPFYGMAPQGIDPDWSQLRAAVEGHFGDLDQRYDPATVERFEETLRDAGVDDVRFFVYPGAKHAFFNDTRKENYDEESARQAWVRTLEFLRAKLG